MISIVLIDNHQSVRRGLKELLETEPDLQVVGEANDGREGIEITRRLRPDILLSDLMMDAMDGIEVTREIARQSENTRTIILSVHDDSGYVSRALREGAKGYVLKEAGIDILIGAIRQVMAGSVYLSPALQRESGGQPAGI